MRQRKLAYSKTYVDDSLSVMNGKYKQSWELLLLDQPMNRSSAFSGERLYLDKIDERAKTIRNTLTGK